VDGREIDECDGVDGRDREEIDECDAVDGGDRQGLMNVMQWIGEIDRD